MKVSVININCMSKKTFGLAVMYGLINRTGLAGFWIG